MVVRVAGERADLRPCPSPNTAAAKQHDASVGDDINAAQAPAESAPVNDAALIEERRRRREAIKAKYKQQEPGFAHQALQSAIVSDKGVDTPREDENAATGDENGE